MATPCIPWQRRASPGAGSAGGPLFVALRRRLRRHQRRQLVRVLCAFRRLPRSARPVDFYVGPPSRPTVVIADRKEGALKGTQQCNGLGLTKP